MANAQMIAKWSPGPIYNVNADVKYGTAPQIGFGTAKKNPLDIKPPLYEEAATVFFMSLNFIG